MFALRDVPIIIDPGVQVLEARLAVDDKANGLRKLGVCLYRLALDKHAAEWLPLVPTTTLPHVFSLNPDGTKSNVLVVYDALGRLGVVYLRNGAGWDRYDVAEEHAGKSVTQFSVRFVFNTGKDRARFLALMAHMTELAKTEHKPKMDDVMAALRILGRARTEPVVLPVAVEKSQLAPIKM